MTEASRVTASAGTGLDHVVINVLSRMDEAARGFTALGFQLTPLGRHSLGSINHLMMTPGAYVELVGVPDKGLQRRDVLESPFGLNGFVLASADADATFERLKASGVPVEPPSSFSRPVTIGGSTKDARFRTVRLPTDTFAAGRVYHCQHLTPDLVWYPPWLGHPNGFLGIDGLRVVDPDPKEAVRRYARASASEAEVGDDGWRVPFNGARLDVVAGHEARFLDLALRFRDLGELERRANEVPAARWMRLGSRQAELDLPTLNVRLQCSS